MCVHVYMCVRVCVCIQVCVCQCMHGHMCVGPQRPEVSDSPGTRVIGTGKSPDLDAGNHIWVLQSSCAYSELLSPLKTLNTISFHFTKVS